jgi:hypothetical protein
MIRLASALGIGFEQMFGGVANWHFRPLAPPEFLPGERPTKGSATNCSCDFGGKDAPKWR